MGARAANWESHLKALCYFVEEFGCDSGGGREPLELVSSEIMFDIC